MTYDNLNDANKIANKIVNNKLVAALIELKNKHNQDKDYELFDVYEDVISDYIKIMKFSTDFIDSLDSLFILVFDELDRDFSFICHIAESEVRFFLNQDNKLEYEII